MELAFAGKASPSTIVSLIVSGYVFKVVYEVAMTPLTYWIVGRLKHAEGVDVYDIDTDFSPFARGDSGAAQVPLGPPLTRAVAAGRRG